MSDQADAGVRLAPVAYAPGEAPALYWSRELLRRELATGEQTAGRFALTEATADAGYASPFHVHHDDDEAIYVLDGAIDLYLGDDVHEGDILASNDPYAGASHLNDIFMFRPVYVDGIRVAFLCLILHHTDMGGRVPGGTATGPYNPHFVRDIGAAYLMAGASLAAFAVWPRDAWPARRTNRRTG